MMAWESCLTPITRVSVIRASVIRAGRGRLGPDGGGDGGRDQAVGVVDLVGQVDVAAAAFLGDGGDPDRDGQSGADPDRAAEAEPLPGVDAARRGRDGPGRLVD